MLRKTKRRGYTLVEAVAALFVLSAGLLGTLQMYDHAMDKMRAMREMAIAGETVQNEIEFLRSIPFAGLQDCENAPFHDLKSDLSKFVNATPALTIRPAADPALRLKEVTATLRWTGDNGRMMKRTATTLIADKEASQP
jgi:type II secretory pathway pseudopilin PulG